MKTRALIITLALLISAAGSVFAWTTQDQLACELAQVNCPVQAQSFAPRAVAVQSAMDFRDRLPCELAQVGCPAGAQSPAPKTAAIHRDMKGQDPLPCRLAQVSCPLRHND